MHGNYRHHYLLSSAAGPQAAATSLPSRQHQQQMASNFNGLPTADATTNGCRQRPQLSASNCSMGQPSRHQELQVSDRLINSSQRPDATGGRFYSQQQLQQQQQQVRAVGRNEYCSQSTPTSELASQRARHHQQQQNSRQRNEYHQQQQQQQSDEAYYNGETANRMNNAPQHHYASQLRNSKMQNNFQHHQPTNQPPVGRPFSQLARGASSGAHPASSQAVADRSHRDQSPSPPQSTSSQQQQQQQHYRKGQAAPADRSLHVNFNRANQAAGADDDEGDSRKKKYLTAKYGQQQMNLIKKRLKIEMWLCEQLKELASGSKSEAELEEIDIDLDQLLDMDDDDTRRRWLKKTLEPFDDIQADRVDKFIGDVLEQSKLL